MNPDIQIHIAVNSYLLRCSLGSLIIEEFGNVSILDKIASYQQLESFIKDNAGILIIEAELLEMLPPNYSIPSLLDVVAIVSGKKHKINGMAKEIIEITDTKNDIIKKIDSIMNPKQHEGVSDQILSDREKEVIRLVAKGYINKEIADMLNLSIHTVITHRKNITQKLGIKTISGLSIYALLNGIIQPNESTI